MTKSIPGVISAISARIMTWFRPLGSRPGSIIALIVIAAFVMAAFIQNYSYNGADEAQNVALAQGDSTQPPDFQFIGRGRITGGTETAWIIGGVPIDLSEHTQLMSDMRGGDFVTLSGRILPNGMWLADRIEISQEEESFFAFNGRLEWIRGSVWRIGRHSLLVNLQTEIGSDLGIGDTLMATFSVLDNGAWLASKIMAFDKFPITPTPTPTATPTQTPEPTSAPTSRPAAKPANKPAPNAKPKKSNSGSVTVCHNPGNKKGGKTMSLDQAALASHLNHGDIIGACR